uniref:Peptidase A1 domain-containing protein n=1 Tax=Kwoniella bestiolae CBS 10118 TaxID=1296100 RepID=A0A1B9FWH3_9TREE|nr:hypothetical protein I302_07464 [Kwoniella bestiolae CBS 10118]OCF23113.1 hypothetical protein I302_07464 [Kwoniella bestiolae CBS 10118]
MNLTIDDRSPQIVYKSTANTWYDNHTTNNLTSQYYDATFWACDGEGDSATLEFSGTAIYVYGAKRDYHGTYSVKLDDGDVEELDGYSDEVLIQELLYKKEGLDKDKIHSITLTNLPSKTTHPKVNKGFSKWYLDIDYFIVTLPNKEEDFHSTTIDDTSPSAQYFGSGWINNATFSASYHNATAKISYGSGDHMELTFTGSNIQVFGTINSDHGGYSISLDGSIAKPYNGEFFQARYSTPLYTATNLSEGEHKLVMQNIGGGKTANGMEFDYAVVNSTKSGSSTNGSGSTSNGNSNSNGNTNSNDSSSSSSNTSESGSSSNVGAIAGGAAGGVVALLAIAGLIWFFSFKRRSNKGTKEKELIDLTGEEVKPFDPQDNTPYSDTPTLHLGVPYTNSSVSANSISNESPTHNTPTNSSTFLTSIPAPPGSNASSYPRTESHYSQSYAPSSSNGESLSPTLIAPSSNTFGHFPTAAGSVNESHNHTLSPISESGSSSTNVNRGRYGYGDTKSLHTLQNYGNHQLDLNLSPTTNQNSPSGLESHEHEHEHEQMLVPPPPEYSESDVGARR